MEISREGTLQFLVNDRSQGAAATNVYSTDKLVYGFVDHYGQAVTSTISEGQFIFLLFSSFSYSLVKRFI